MEKRPFETHIHVLRNRLNQDLPGTAAHLTMAPANRQHPEQLRIEEKPCRSAGVMALLFPYQDDSAGIILTKRRADLPEHAGQIAFPGGRQEHEETLVQTALRETREEIGLPSSSIHVLGSLSPLYINVSNYCVHPFVGILDAHPAAFTLQVDEVQKVLSIPIAQLADPQTRRTEMRTIRGQLLEIPFYSVDNEVIWGATAMVLAELLMVWDTLSTVQK